MSRTSYRRATRSRVVLAALLAASVTVVTLDFRQGNNGPLRKVQDEVLTVLAPLQAVILLLGDDQADDFLGQWLDHQPGLHRADLAAAQRFAGACRPSHAAVPGW